MEGAKEPMSENGQQMTEDDDSYNYKLWLRQPRCQTDGLVVASASKRSCIRFLGPSVIGFFRQEFFSNSHGVWIRARLMATDSYPITWNLKNNLRKVGVLLGTPLPSPWGLQA